MALTPDGKSSNSSLTGTHFNVTPSLEPLEITFIASDVFRYVASDYRFLRQTTHVLSC
jgi:hypothetical protein